MKKREAASRPHRFIRSGLAQNAHGLEGGSEGLALCCRLLARPRFASPGSALQLWLAPERCALLQQCSSVVASRRRCYTEEEAEEALAMLAPGRGSALVFPGRSEEAGHAGLQPTSLQIGRMKG